MQQPDEPDEANNSDGLGLNIADAGFPLRHRMLEIIPAERLHVLWLIDLAGAKPADERLDRDSLDAIGTDLRRSRAGLCTKPCGFVDKSCIGTLGMPIE